METESGGVFRPVRVAHVVTGLSQGGAERQLYLLLQGLDRRRFRPVVLVRHATARDYWTGPLRALDVEVHELPGQWSALRRYWGLWKALRHFKPQVVQGWTLWTNPQLALLGRLGRIPVRLGAIRCNLHRAGRGSVERWMCTRGLDRLVANSSQGKRDLIALGVPERRIEVIFNAVQADPEIEQLDRETVRRSWEVKDGEVVLASIGNLTRPKNYPLLLAVVRRLREQGNPVKAVVYGEGPLRAELEAEIRASGLSGVVRLCGQDPKARCLVAAADIFVLTSWGEGMANALLEGALAGLPVVTTAVGGADDVVRVGETGYVVPVNDAPALTEVVERLIKEPGLRRHLGRNGRQRALGEFSPERMVERFQTLYLQTLAEKSPFSVTS